MRLRLPARLDPRALSHRGAIGVLALVILAVWWPCLVGDQAPLLGEAQAHMLPWRAASPPPPDARWDALLWDGMAQYFPWRTFMARMVRRGLIPLWNPHQFCGTPMLANGQTAFFYPPNWLFALVNVRYAFGLCAALHYLLAGVFMLLLARELGLRPAAALVGALAYTLGGFIVCWTALPTLMNTAAWLPGVMWALERAFRRRDSHGGVLVALTLAMALLAGHLQIAVYVWLTAGLHALARSVWALRRRQLAAPVSALAGAVLAGALAMGQLLPTAELAQRSPRGTVVPTEDGYRFRAARALQPFMLTTLVLPDALGKPDDWARAGLAYSETCGYVGRLTLLLALVGLAALRSRQAAWYAGLAALALLGAMDTPVTRLLYFHVPGLGQAGGFGRVLCVYGFAVAVLAAMGAEWLARRMSEMQGGGLVPRLGPWLPLLAGGVVALELSLWARSFLPLSPRERLYPATQLTQRLTELCQGGDRVLAVTRREDWTIQRLPKALLPPNAATVYGYNDVQGYDSLFPATFEEYAARLAPQGHSPAANGNMVLFDDLRAVAEHADDVRWLVLPAGASPPGDRFAPRWEGEGVTLYENPEARPRVGSDFSVGPMLAPSLSTGDPCLLRIDAEFLRIAVADTAYPGWRAYVDGVPTPLERHPLMGWRVHVPADARRLDMAYAPASFAAGVFVSLCGVAVACAWLAFGCRRRAPNVVGSGVSAA